MSAYLIFAVDISDPAAYGEYVKHTPRTIADFGGRMIVRGGAPEVLEGAGFASRMVVVEFADRAAAQRFYHSPQYQKIKAIRTPASKATGVIVDGYATDAWTAAVVESRTHA